MEGHDSAACNRRLSRRYFFGLCAGAAGIVAAPSIIESSPRLPTVNYYSMKPSIFSGKPLLRKDFVAAYEELYRVLRYTPPGGVYGRGAGNSITFEMVAANDPRVTPNMKPIYRRIVWPERG